MPVRCVIDTNVFVGACLGVGAASRVVAACLQRRAVPLMGAAMLAEYEDVLGREKLFQQCRLDAIERQELFDIFLATCEWTRVYFGWRPNLPDEADNHVIELAVAGHAQCVVTRNIRDFVRAELTFPGLRCLTPADFLNLENLQ